MRNDGGLDQGSGSRAGAKVTDTRYVWEVALADRLDFGCVDRRRSKRKIKNASQALGLSKMVDGNAIHRDSGDHREPGVCLMPPGTAATFVCCFSWANDRRSFLFHVPSAWEQNSSKL